MNEHASLLELDEAAAGLSNDAVRAHLAACVSCGLRLAALSADRKSVSADANFQQTLAKLPRGNSGRRAQRFYLSFALGSLAICAAVFIVARPSRELRAKGSPSIELLTPAGLESTSPRVGDEVDLKMFAGSHRYAFVVAVDEAGSKALWPAGATTSGELDSTRHALVRLRATPGTSRIIAAFSDEPLALDEVVRKQARPQVEFREREIRPVP